jgi:hypothetical protein
MNDAQQTSLLPFRGYMNQLASQKPFDHSNPTGNTIANQVLSHLESF